MSAIPLLSSANDKSVSPDWRSLYLTALFETDKSRLPGRIFRAERALLQREHELFSNGGMEERTVVNNALNALRALRRCLAA